MKTINKDEALVMMTNLCARQEKCTSEVIQKLKTLGVSQNNIDEIIDYLIDNNYIDLKRYCTSFVNDKLKFNKWGKNKIRYELRSKNIDSSIIEQAISQIDETEYKDLQISELTKKMKTIEDADKQKIYSKLFNFATSRGYSTDIIKYILNNKQSNTLEDD